MYSLTKPTFPEIEKYLEHQGQQPFSSADVGASLKMGENLGEPLADMAPYAYLSRRYATDRHRVLLA